MNLRTSKFQISEMAWMFHHSQKHSFECLLVIIAVAVLRSKSILTIDNPYYLFQKEVVCLSSFTTWLIWICPQELKLLDEQNNPLTHARYHQEEVREAGERHRRPCRIEIPKDLEQRIQEYLSQVTCIRIHIGQMLWSIGISLSTRYIMDKHFILNFKFKVPLF